MSSAAFVQQVVDSNRTKVSTTFGFFPEQTFKCQNVECDVLPWVKSNYDIQSTIQGALERHTNQFWSTRQEEISDNWKACSESSKRGLSKVWKEWRRELSSVVKRQLEQYQIEIDVELDVTVNHHIRALRQPGIRPEWLNWKPYEKVLKENGQALQVEDIQLFSEQVVAFSPDPEQAQTFITITSKRKLRLKEITLKEGNQTIVKTEMSQVLEDSTPQKIRLPALPVASYPLFTNADEESTLDVRLKFAGGGSVLLKVPVQVPRLDREPAVLFIDLGSTTSKLANIRLRPFSDKVTTSFDFDTPIGVAIGRRLQKPDVAKSLATMFQPKATTAFTEKWNLPRYRKKKLVDEGEEALADWFGTAARRFATGLAKKDRPVAKIYWSFPEVEDVKLKKLKHLVKVKASPWMLGTPEIMTEHESLRHRYERTLQLLAEAAEKRHVAKKKAEDKNRRVQKKRRDAENSYKQEKRKHEKKGVVRRFFSSEPEQPNLSKYKDALVPALEAWHKEFVTLSIDSGLNEFVIVDAGGYTLDIYVKRKGQEAYGHSFEAGGEDLTRRIEQYLKTKQRSEGDLFELAEHQKVELCTARRQSKLGRKIKDWTEEIYGPAVDQGFKKGLSLEKNQKLEGIPLILSGGGMRNPWLVKLLERKLDTLGVQALKVNSETLTEDITTFDLDEPTLNRFQSVTYGFAPEKNRLDLRFDIVGGLIERATDIEA